MSASGWQRIVRHGFVLVPYMSVLLVCLTFFTLAPEPGHLPWFTWPGLVLPWFLLSLFFAQSRKAPAGPHFARLALAPFFSGAAVLQLWAWIAQPEWSRSSAIPMAFAFALILFFWPAYRMRLQPVTYMGSCLLPGLIVSMFQICTDEQMTPLGSARLWFLFLIALPLLCLSIGQAFFSIVLMRLFRILEMRSRGD